MKKTNDIKTRQKYVLLLAMAIIPLTICDQIRLFFNPLPECPPLYPPGTYMEGKCYTPEYTGEYKPPSGYEPEKPLLTGEDKNFWDGLDVQKAEKWCVARLKMKEEYKSTVFACSCRLERETEKSKSYICGVSLNQLVTVSTGCRAADKKCTAVIQWPEPPTETESYKFSEWENVLK